MGVAGVVGLSPRANPSLELTTSWRSIGGGRGRVQLSPVAVADTASSPAPQALRASATHPTAVGEAAPADGHARTSASCGSADGSEVAVSLAASVREAGPASDSGGLLQGAGGSTTAAAAVPTAATSAHGFAPDARTEQVVLLLSPRRGLGGRPVSGVATGAAGGPGIGGGGGGGGGGLQGVFSPRLARAFSPIAAAAVVSAGATADGCPGHGHTHPERVTAGRTVEGAAVADPGPWWGDGAAQRDTSSPPVLAPLVPATAVWVETAGEAAVSVGETSAAAVASAPSSPLSGDMSGWAADAGAGAGAGVGVGDAVGVRGPATPDTGGREDRDEPAGPATPASEVSVDSVDSVDSAESAGSPGSPMQVHPGRPLVLGRVAEVPEVVSPPWRGRVNNITTVLRHRLTGYPVLAYVPETRCVEGA